ncbi:DUF3761 domain-containing protein [Candidatus Saccharibacteria bacterium]|nr:DUF3761 domain-containing protein [Candidatus Saccharibacteria bacterium]
MTTKSKIITTILFIASIIGTGAITVVQNDNIESKNSAYTGQENKKISNFSELVGLELKLETETKEIEIPFSTETVEDNTVAKGTSYIKSEGQNGTRTETYEVLYINGEEKGRKRILSKTTKEPIKRVVVEGTYVKPKTSASNCPNGTYKNSAGNTVCRPASTNTGGATAICRDGTYSYSQSRRGTCSHHGGVKKWL